MYCPSVVKFHQNAQLNCTLTTFISQLSQPAEVLSAKATNPSLEGETTLELCLKNYLSVEPCDLGIDFFASLCKFLLKAPEHFKLFNMAKNQQRKTFI